MSASSDTGPPPPNAAPRRGAGAMRDDGDNSPPIARPAEPGKGIEANGSSRIRTFRQRFHGGAVCTMRFDIDEGRAGKGTVEYQHCEWSCNPGPLAWQEFKFWTLSVNQRVANETGHGRVELLQIAPQLWQIWSFEPGQLPRKSGELVTS